MIIIDGNYIDKSYNEKWVKLIKKKYKFIRSTNILAISINNNKIRISLDLETLDYDFEYSKHMVTGVTTMEGTKVDASVLYRLSDIIDMWCNSNLQIPWQIGSSRNYQCWEYNKHGIYALSFGKRYKSGLCGHGLVSITAEQALS
jgi:hypothetical protein